MPAGNKRGCWSLSFVVFHNYNATETCLKGCFILLQKNIFFTLVLLQNRVYLHRF